MTDDSKFIAKIKTTNLVSVYTEKGRGQRPGLDGLREYPELFTCSIKVQRSEVIGKIKCVGVIQYCRFTG